MRLVYLTFGWVAGIILAAALPAISLPAWVILAFLGGLALWLVRAYLGYRMTVAALLMVALAGLRFQFVPTTSAIAAYNNTGGLTIEGVVVDEPDLRDDRVQLRVAAESVTAAGETQTTEGLVLVEAARLVEVQYGDRITATGLLITPAEFDTFSYGDYLARGGVFSIMRNTALEVLDSGQGSPFFAALLELKAQAQAAIARHLPEPAASLLMGILLGNERGIAPEVQDAFSAVGASHIVAISGFNMVIISGVVMQLLERLFRRKGIAALLGILVIAIYTIFVGANAAVVRAAIMSSLLAVAPLMKRKTYIPASLAFVALLMSLVNPTVLWDISFQLSFFATLGLVLFVDPIKHQFDKLFNRVVSPDSAPSVREFLFEPLVVTLAAQITTLPLIILYFGRLSLLSILVNLLVIPVQTPLLILGALATIMAFMVPAVAQILYWFDLILLMWTIEVVRAFAALPFANVAFSVDSRLILLFFVIVLGGALMQATQPRWWLALGRFTRRRAVVSATVFSGVLLLILMAAIYLGRPDGQLHVWLLDVGHSNAILVQTPGGAQMLIDGGQYPSRLLTAIGDRLPFYDREIEVLAITQPDEFDFSALPAVLARYDVGVALVNGQPNLSEAYEELQVALASHDVVTARAGYTLDFDDGVQVEVLHPQTLPQLTDRLNDSALVLRLTYQDVSFLFTTDMSSEGQAALIEAGQWPLATVMQLPQHGAARALDTDFLQAVQPQVIVLQSDRANRRGDPDADTLALLGDTPLLRTDEGGTIHLWTDGTHLWSVQNQPEANS